MNQEYWASDNCTFCLNIVKSKVVMLILNNFPFIDMQIKAVALKSAFIPPVVDSFWYQLILGSNASISSSSLFL